MALVLMGIVGISSAIAFTGYSQAIAQTTPNTPDTSTTPGTRVSTLDTLYVTEAGQGGMAEVQLAQLALQKSRDNNIRQYAQQMIREHTPVNQQLMELAKKKGITPPTDVGPKYQAAIARLSQFSGSNFDQAYTNEAGINLHIEYLVVQQRRLGMAETEAILKRFTKANLLHPTHQALMELGKAVKTIILLDLSTYFHHKCVSPPP